MQRETEHRLIYGIAALAVVGLLVWGIASFRHQQDSEEAQAKADELVSLYHQHGLPTPENTDQLTATLGTDGGQLCATATDDYSQSLYKLTTALHVGSIGGTAVTLDRDVVEGGALIVEVYCPDKLAEYRAFIDEDLSTETGVIDLD